MRQMVKKNVINFGSASDNQTSKPACAQNYCPITFLLSEQEKSKCRKCPLINSHTWVTNYNFRDITYIISESQRKLISPLAFSLTY